MRNFTTFYSTYISMRKSRRMRKVDHVASLGEAKMHAASGQERGHWDNLAMDRRIIIKYNLNRTGGECGLHLSGPDSD